MSQNRFLLNYSEYRNHIVTHKYKNYEIYLKKYEINYNKWLKSMNYVQKNLKTHYLKIEPRRLFKCYVQRIY